MFEDFRRELHLSDVSGHRFGMSLAEVRRSMLAPTGLTFLGLAVAMLLFSDPPGLLNYLPLGVAAGIWITALICHLAGIFTYLALAGHLQKRGDVKTIWLPVISLLALAPTVSTTELLVFAIVGPDYPVIVMRKVIFYFVIVQILEFAFIRFVLIRDLRDPANDAAPASAPSSPPVPAPERMLDLGDRRLPLRRLRYFAAQEHYVEIVLDADRILRRVRFSDLLAQTEAQDGVQPHRSWWVSRHAKPRLEKRSGRYVIVMDDGTEVPVARGRATEVVDWFDQNGPFGEVDAQAG